MRQIPSHILAFTHAISRKRDSIRTGTTTHDTVVPATSLQVAPGRCYTPVTYFKLECTHSAREIKINQTSKQGSYIQTGVALSLQKLCFQKSLRQWRSTLRCPNPLTQCPTTKKEHSQIEGIINPSNYPPTPSISNAPRQP